MSALSNLSAVRAQEATPVITEPAPNAPPQPSQQLAPEVQPNQYPQPFQPQGNDFQQYQQPQQNNQPQPFQQGGDFQQNQQPKPYQQQGQQPQMNQMQPFSMPSDGVKFDQKNGDGGGQGMQQGQMQGNNNQNQGPSDEDRQKQDEQMEKRRLEMEKQGLTQMKRGMKQAATGVKRMKKDFEKFAKKKVNIPQECADAMQQIEGIISAVNAAEDMDAAQEAGAEDMPEIFDTLNECRNRLEMLARVPQMIARVNRELKNIERLWVKAKKNPPADTADVVAEGDAAIQEIKTARDKVQTLANEGNMDDIEGVLEDEVFGKFDDVTAAINQLQAARNAKLYATQFNQRIRADESLIKKLKLQKKDTSELEQIVADAKSQYANLKSFKVGSDEWEDVISSLADLEQSFADAAGTGEDIGSFFITKPSQTGPELMVPKEFGF